MRKFLVLFMMMIGLMLVSCGGNYDNKAKDSINPDNLVYLGDEISEPEECFNFNQQEEVKKFYITSVIYRVYNNYEEAGTANLKIKYSYKSTKTPYEKRTGIAIVNAHVEALSENEIKAVFGVYGIYIETLSVKFY